MARYYKIKNGKRGDEIDVIQAQHLRANEYERVVEPCKYCGEVHANSFECKYYGSGVRGNEI